MRAKSGMNSRRVSAALAALALVFCLTSSTHTASAFQVVNNNFGWGGRQKPERRIEVQVTLEEIYNGAQVPIYVQKDVLCPHCKGTGADRPEDVVVCQNCKGQGVVIQKHQIAPGMFQQYQMMCDRCGGRGRTTKSRCHVCLGKNRINMIDPLKVNVDKGIPDGHLVRAENAGNMGEEDLLYQINQLPHPDFKRLSNNDLHTRLYITLEQALLGFKTYIKHLDGRLIEVSRTQVTQPGETMTIRSEGMSFFKQPQRRGNLIVEFIVTIPEQFNEEQLRLWEKFFVGKY